MQRRRASVAVQPCSSAEATQSPHWRRASLAVGAKDIGAGVEPDGSTPSRARRRASATSASRRGSFSIAEDAEELFEDTPSGDSASHDTHYASQLEDSHKALGALLQTCEDKLLALRPSEEGAQAQVHGVVEWLERVLKSA